MKKYQNFLSKNFPFLVVKFSIYVIEQACFRNENYWILQNILNNSKDQDETFQMSMMM